MRLALVVSPALCASTALWSAPTSAETAVTANGQVVFGYDDNITAAPTDADPIGAFGLEVSPGVALYYDEARARVVLRYSHPVFFYFGHLEQSSTADVGSALGLFHLSAVDELLVAFEARRQSTALLALAEPQQTTTEARVTGSQPFVSLAASEVLQHDFSSAWSLEQGAEAAVTIPTGSDSTQQLVFTGAGSLGPELSVGSHALALITALRYTHGEPAAAPTATGVASERTDQLFPSAMLRWRWDWTEFWSSEARAGVALPYLVGGNVSAAPVGGAAIRYREPGYGVSLEYARDFRANSLTAQTFYSDTILLSGAIPIWRPYDLMAATSTGFAWNRMAALGPTQVVERANTWVTDVGVGWYPRELVPSIAIRYQHVQQLATPEGQTLLLDFSRNVVSLTLGYRYPVVHEPAIDPRPSERVDRGDSVSGEPGEPVPRR